MKITEGQLRRIIRQEVRALGRRPGRRLFEMGGAPMDDASGFYTPASPETDPVMAQANEAAQEMLGFTGGGGLFYIDYDLEFTDDELAGVRPGSNVVDLLRADHDDVEVADVVVRGEPIFPELFDILGGDDMVIMKKLYGPGGGMSIVRFYGDKIKIGLIADALGEMEGGPSRRDLIRPL